MQLSFQVDWVIELSRNFRIASEDLSWSIWPFHAWAIWIIKERSDSIFESKGNDIANWPSWKPLAPSTNKAREKRSWYYKKSPDKPWVLRRTGNLQNSAVQTSNDKQWELKYTAPYAIKHQRGGKNLPRRKIIDINPWTWTKIQKLLQKTINDALGVFWRQK